MSKQEARLPEKVQEAIANLLEAADDDEACDVEAVEAETALRAAILAALDEARDEAIEGAQQAAFKEMTRRHAKDGTSCGTIDQACIRAAIRALKSKR